MKTPIAACSLFLLALAAPQEPLRVHVNVPRPIAAAADAVEAHFGRVVTYEDTRYIHPEDIVDVTDEVSRSPDRSKRILAMRRERIDVEYVPAGGTTDDQVAAALDEILASARRTRNIGDFRVDRVSGGFHVVPVAIKGRSGAREPYAPLLDTPITLWREEGTIARAMERITADVSERTGLRLVRGVEPTNLFVQRHVTLEANNERARDVLWRVLQSVRPDLSWRLLCSVGEKGECALSVHFLRKK